MARAEISTPEPEVTVTLSKREAAMLVALSGYICSYEGLSQELYELLHEIGRPYGDLHFYGDAHDYLGTTVAVRAGAIYFRGEEEQ